MADLRWKVHRLRTMAPAEVAWRIAQQLSARLESLGLGRIPAKLPADHRARCWLGGPPAGLDRAAILVQADAIVEGRFDVFALRGEHLGLPPQWNRDPRTGRVAPMTFGKTLNYRDPELVGDIKYLWEPSRHLELVTLAQAYLLTRDERYPAALRLLVESWFDQCPYPLGVHWTSSLEHGVRLLNWSMAWQLLQCAGWWDLPASGGPFRDRWLGEVYRHQRFVAGHFSRHSSANNHLLGEYTGLFIAAVTWPLWTESARWRAMAQAGLEREALLQNAPDGGNREQGLWYHHEVADMLLLTLLAGRRSGHPFGEAYAKCLESMTVFVASLIDPAGRMPMIGDADDAVMVRFAPAPQFNVFRSLLASAAVLFERADLARAAGSFDDKSRWLLGAEGEAAFDGLSGTRSENPSARPVQGLPRAFPDSGYWILGNRLGQHDELRVIADAGPIGYLSIAAHGHADALALTLSAGGTELLVDPGTYAYHTQREWRDYFKGTSAHNTVRVDGLDQSVSAGNFMWLHHASARCEVFKPASAQDLWVASHDGYQRLPDPVQHRRQVLVRHDQGMVEVTDALECQAEHSVEVFWHFAEDCRVRIDDGVVWAECEGASLRMTVTGAELVPELVCGREKPPLGWVSRSFDRKQPTCCVFWTGRVGPGGSWTTRLEIRLASDLAKRATTERLSMGVS